MIYGSPGSVKGAKTGTPRSLRSAGRPHAVSSEKVLRREALLPAAELRGSFAADVQPLHQQLAATVLRGDALDVRIHRRVGSVDESILDVVNIHGKRLAAADRGGGE